MTTQLGMIELINYAETAEIVNVIIEHPTEHMTCVIYSYKRPGCARYDSKPMMLYEFNEEDMEKLAQARADLLKCMEARAADDVPDL